MADGFCSVEMSATSSGTNRGDFTLSTREGASGLLPRLTIDARGDATLSNNLMVGSGSSSTGGPISSRGNGGSSVWNDGVTRTRLAKFENDESEATRTTMTLWSDNNKGVVLQGGTNSGNLSLGTRTGATDNINMTIDGLTGNVTFSGRVDAALGEFGSGSAKMRLQGAKIWRSDSSGSGLYFLSASIRPTDSTGTESNGVLSLGHNAAKFKDAYFSGTVDAADFTVNGVPIGGGGLPDGDFTHNGKITATDFIATSDERVKDNITTAPVGLIDSLKGREWDWKESGEKGSGVVAQELEQVLPHLVHEDDDGMKSVSYMGLLAYCIEELKDCRQRIAELEAKS